MSVLTYGRLHLRLVETLTTNNRAAIELIKLARSIIPMVHNPPTEMTVQAMLSLQSCALRLSTEISDESAKTLHVLEQLP